MTKYYLHFLVLSFLLILGCTTPSSELDKKQLIRNFLIEKTNINFNEKFKIISYEIIHTEGALDDDYRWNFEIELDEKELKLIDSQIKTSPFFNENQNYDFAATVYDSLLVYQLNGFWTKKGTNYFWTDGKNQNAEMTYMNLNKENKILYVELIHI